MHANCDIVIPLLEEEVCREVDLEGGGGGAAVEGLAADLLLESELMVPPPDRAPESPQKLPPMAPNMSLANDESPTPPDVVVGVAVGVVDGLAAPLVLPRAELPPRKELRVESESRESPRRERGAVSRGAAAAVEVGLLLCPDCCPEGVESPAPCPGESR